MEAHFVTFFSPGTFVAEQSEKPIESWDIDKAMEMALFIKERYAAVPYGFKFTTRTRGDNDLDSKVSKRSGMYYLGGKVETIEEVEARGDPKEAILLSNMKGNGYKSVITNTNSWEWTQPFDDDDVLLEMFPAMLARAKAKSA